MKFTLFILLAMLFGVTGCGHLHKVSPDQPSSVTEAVEFNIGSKEVKEGDILNIYDQSCRKVRRPRNSEKCIDRKIGEGRVSKVIDENSSLVIPNDGIKIDKTMKVERK